jgi:hypothetical protein
MGLSATLEDALSGLLWWALASIGLRWEEIGGLWNHDPTKFQL